MYSKISENQIGFKTDQYTIDNAFTLKSIVDRFLNKKGGNVYV